jgi:Xaa-Pro aminopeptidase
MKVLIRFRVTSLSDLVMSSPTSPVSVSSHSSTTPQHQSTLLIFNHAVDNSGQWGMRIESALAVKKIKTRGEFNGDIWLGFERLTCVPIQTKMVKENMLSKEEKQWLKVCTFDCLSDMDKFLTCLQDHNKRCKEKLEPLLKDDKRALKWLSRESERGIGIAGTGPSGISIDWD